MTTETGIGMMSEDPSAAAQSWYVLPSPPAPAGWLTYSRDFILAVLQGRAASSHMVVRSRSWLLIGMLVQCAMAPLQAGLMLLAWVPVVSRLFETLSRVFSRGTTGFFLRSCYWKAKLKHLGQDTIIDQYVDIWGSKNISIGSKCHIDTNVRLSAGERHHGQHGSIIIGNFVHVGPGVHIAGRGGVEIRDFVAISANAHLYSATAAVESPHDPGQLLSMSHMAPHDQQYVVEAPIRIDEYAFIGIMARILPGVSIGRGAIVHSNTQVTRSLPPFANYGGVLQGRLIGFRTPRRRSPHLSKIQAQPQPSGESNAHK
jgi:acetyltransferase-like isoleucine patch superfamily enzyme